MSKIRRDQCCNCSWIGTHDEKVRDDDSNRWGWKVETYLCPICGHDEFYEATEKINYLKS